MNKIVLALKDLNNRLVALEHTVNDVIVKSLVDANNEYEYNSGLDEFRNKYGSELSKYDSILKSANGDDFDACKELYDKSRGVEDEAAFVAEQIKVLTDKLNKMGISVEVDAPADEQPLTDEQLVEKFLGE